MFRITQTLYLWLAMCDLYVPRHRSRWPRHGSGECDDNSRARRTHIFAGCLWPGQGGARIATARGERAGEHDRTRGKVALTAPERELFTPVASTSFQTAAHALKFNCLMRYYYAGKTSKRLSVRIERAYTISTPLLLSEAEKPSANASIHVL